MLPAFIAIEGIDGAGKATQARLLAQAAERFGQTAKVFSFPDYSTPSGQLIGAYLRGEVEGDPRLIAAMYSLNRLEKRDEIFAAFQGPPTCVIFDRYAWSNIHNMVKFGRVDSDEFKTAMDFIRHIEYDICKAVSIPSRANVLLDVPSGFAQRQVATKESRSYIDKPGEAIKADRHEGDLSHLQMANEAFRRIADGSEWTVVNCTEGNDVMRTPEDINAEIVTRLRTR